MDRTKINCTWKPFKTMWLSTFPQNSRCRMHQDIAHYSLSPPSTRPSPPQTRKKFRQEDCELKNKQCLLNRGQWRKACIWWTCSSHWRRRCVRWRHFPFAQHDTMLAHRHTWPHCSSCQSSLAGQDDRREWPGRCDPSHLQRPHLLRQERRKIERAGRGESVLERVNVVMTTTSTSHATFLGEVV